MEKLKKHGKRFLKICAFTLMTVTTAVAFAVSASASAGGTGTLETPAGVNNIISFFVGLLRIAGGVAAIIGAVMFFMALQGNDAHGKTQGMLTVLAGAGVLAVAIAGPALFGI